MKVCLVLALALSSAGCGREERAVLDDAHGLGDDSPVYVQGVKVGTVQSVRLADGRAEVAFEIESEHEVTLNADACAFATDLRGTPVLVVLSGERRGARESGPLPQCELPADQLAQVLESFGGAFRGMLDQMMRGFTGGAPSFPMPSQSFPMPSPSFPMPAPMPAPAVPAPSAPSAPSTPSTPGPAGSGGGVCESLSLQVGSVEALAIPLPMAAAGHRVSLRITNAGTTPFELSAAPETMFLAPGRRALTRLQVPLPGIWFMPLQVPAAGSVDTSIVLSSADGQAPVLETIELGAGTGPFDSQRCTLRAR